MDEENHEWKISNFIDICRTYFIQVLNLHVFF